MRLWSLHPKYLDRQGLVALWREGLLAQHVLAGKTKGYRRHPQLIRFQETRNPLLHINAYLSDVYREAKKRGYNFQVEKIVLKSSKNKIVVSDGQLAYEFSHLLKKLALRDPKKFKELKALKIITAAPLFKIIKGERAIWEKV